MGDLRGRGVLVAGGTGGIGAATANTFHAYGATTTVIGLPPIAEDLHPGVKVITADLTDPASAELIAGLGRLDVLVNCAGVIRRDEELDPEVFEHVLRVNLTGTMRACTAARPALARTGGAIVNTASMLSYFGSASAPAYSASKGGVMQLTRSLAAAYAADGIRVNAVAPGWIRTALTAPLQADDAAQRRILDRTPMRRWGTPADVAAAVVFLASPQAAFITGAVLPVDGGYHAV